MKESVKKCQNLLKKCQKLPLSPVDQRSLQQLLACFSILHVDLELQDPEKPLPFMFFMTFLKSNKELKLIHADAKDLIPHYFFTLVEKILKIPSENATLFKTKTALKNFYFTAIKALKAVDDSPHHKKSLAKIDETSIYKGINSKAFKTLSAAKSLLRLQFDTDVIDRIKTSKDTIKNIEKLFLTLTPSIKTSESKSPDSSGPEDFGSFGPTFSAVQIVRSLSTSPTGAAAMPPVPGMPGDAAIDLDASGRPPTPESPIKK